MRVVALASFVLVVVAAAVVVVVLGLTSSNAKTPEETQTTTAELDQLRLRIDPGIWTQMERQAWFNKGNPTEDGLRLMTLISEYYVSERPFLAQQVLNSYPAGLTSETEQAFLGLDSGHLIRNVAVEAWFLDGVDDYEAAFLNLLAAAWARSGPGWTFDQVLFDIVETPWFTDGLDEKESVVLGAAGALSGRNQERALQLIAGLEGDAFIYQTLNLAASGEKTLIVTAATGDLGGQLDLALDLVTRWMQGVEDFAGPYIPQYVLLSVEEPSETVCGTAQSDKGDVPGFVSLYLGCLEDATVIHELAHIFVGSGPIWFTEGIADLVVYHLTGESGNYLQHPVTGLIDIRARREVGAVGVDTSPEYQNQGALGAKLLHDVYQLLGPELTSGVIKEITSGKWPKEGPVLARLFREGTPVEKLPTITTLFDERFGSQQ